MDASDAARLQILLDTHQFDKVRVLALEALGHDPTDGIAHLVLGRVSMANGDLEAAERHLRASTGDPASGAEAYGELSNLIALDPARQAESAEAALAAVRLDPHDWRYRNIHAVALRDAGDTEGAMREVDAAQRLLPDDPAERARALSRIGVTLVRLPWRARGLELVAEATALDPSDPSLQRNLLAAQISTKRWAASVPTAAAYLALQPTAPLPPLAARISVFMLTNRLLGWMSLVAFLASMALAPLGANPNLPDWFDDITVRALSLLALLGFLLVGAKLFGPLLNASGLRALWRFARRSALAWFGAIVTGLCLSFYVAGLILGPLAMVAMFPLLIFPVAWWLHGWGVHALKIPDMRSMIVQELR